MENLPQDRVFKSVMCNRVSDLADKIGETALDSLLMESFVKDIPLVGTALTLLKAGNDIQSYLFTKKIVYFLSEAEKVPFETRQKFANECESDSNRKDKLGESVLVVLDSAKNMDSATYLGRNFALLMSGEISEHTFYTYSHIISSLSPHISQQIIFSYRNEWMSSFSGDSMHFLNSLGLINMAIKPYKINGEVELQFLPETNDFGRSFYKDILTDSVGKHT